MVYLLGLGGFQGKCHEHRFVFTCQSVTVGDLKHLRTCISIRADISALKPD